MEQVTTNFKSAEGAKAITIHATRQGWQETVVVKDKAVPNTQSATQFLAQQLMASCKASYIDDKAQAESRVTLEATRKKMVNIEL